MSEITIYQKPTCTTCRQVYATLKEVGVDFQSVDYYVEPLTKDQLRSLLTKAGISAAQALRKRDKYKELNIDENSLSNDELIDLMVEHPDLLQRPIVEKGSRAILARPAERIKEIL